MHRVKGNEFLDFEKYPSNDITREIISCAIQVHSSLGPGLLENIYEEALGYEFSSRKIAFERQREINILYKERNVGKFRLDFLIEDQVIVELKAVDVIHPIFEAQLLTYLKALNKKVGLLINFNVEKLVEGVKRMVL